MNKKQSTLLIIFIALATIVSSVDFAYRNTIETDPHWRPIHWVKNSEFEEASHIDNRYGAYIFLRYHTRDAVVYAPVRAEVMGSAIEASFTHRLYGIANISAISRVDYDSENFLDVDELGEYVLVSGRDSSEINPPSSLSGWAVVAKQTPIHSMVYVRDNSTDYFVDTRLLSNKELEVLHDA